MSQHTTNLPRYRIVGRIALFLALFAGPITMAQAGGGPIDMPKSIEPRVAAGKCLSAPGLVASEGNFLPYTRVAKGETIHTRDLLVAIPGFGVVLEPVGKNVSLTLQGNLPELSDSPVLESAVILHDTKAYDLDFTFIRGRVILTNTRTKGAAKIWLRKDIGVQLTLPEPGDCVALEAFGRWPTGEAFSRTRKAGDGPVQLWAVHCLKGKLEIKANKTEWSMSAAPGLAYFNGDSTAGPAASGPERRDNPPSWADPKAQAPPLAVTIKGVVETYTGKLRDKELEEIGGEMISLAEKEKDPKKARALRQIAIHAMIALDEPEKVAELLGDSKVPEVRQIAVIGLRHWIGSREGRDMKLYEILQDELSYTRAEAETIMQLLHSPFDRNQPETYETLVAFLKHRKQSIRELAHWHLVRLAPGGRDIPYDAGADAADRGKAAAAWKKLIPDGELPPGKKDGTKKTDKGE